MGNGWTGSSDSERLIRLQWGVRTISWLNLAKIHFQVHSSGCWQDSGPLSLLVGDLPPFHCPPFCRIAHNIAVGSITINKLENRSRWARQQPEWFCDLISDWHPITLATFGGLEVNQSHPCTKGCIPWWWGCKRTEVTGNLLRSYISHCWHVSSGKRKFIRTYSMKEEQVTKQHMQYDLSSINEKEQKKYISVYT